MFLPSLRLYAVLLHTALSGQREPVNAVPIILCGLAEELVSFCCVTSRVALCVTSGVFLH
jgi:hypothetical protein